MTPPSFVTATNFNAFLCRRNLRTTCAQRPDSSVPSKGRRQSPNMRVYDVEIDLNGQKHTIPIDEDMTLLEGIEENGYTVLNSCRAGVCITCAAKLLAGEIDPGYASITDDLKEEGYVLTCSAYPRSEGIKLEMNHFDDAYDKQYGQFEAGKA
ncbi:unnamed protein product [Agarophyton chilense]